jgi:hypothetical protein
MTFLLIASWQIQFLEADLKTALPKTLTFTDSDKIKELASKGRRGETQMARVPGAILSGNGTDPA